MENILGPVIFTKFVHMLFEYSMQRSITITYVWTNWLNEMTKPESSILRFSAWNLLISIRLQEIAGFPVKPLSQKQFGAWFRTVQTRKDG